MSHKNYCCVLIIASGRVLLKAGVHPKAVFWLGFIFLMQISRFTFQAIKNIYAHFTYLCFGSFCRFFGDF